MKDEACIHRGEKVAAVISNRQLLVSEPLRELEEVV